MTKRTPKDRCATDPGEDNLKKEKLSAHRGLATWGEQLVPLERFREATGRAGRVLDAVARERARTILNARRPDPTTIEGPYSRIVVFGGVYNNHFALAALLDAAREHDADAVYCLGDLGGFGPNPERVRPLLEQGGVLSIQGNYEESLATGHENCNCGYTDPRDNHFAELSYNYTAANTSAEFKSWMGNLPGRRRVRIGSREFLLVHGSPRTINEFLFESISPDPFLEILLNQESADGLLFTHTGLHWHRRLPSGRDAVNVGVIGRPANDGRASVWYTLIEATGTDVSIRHQPLAYDQTSLIAEMRTEELPEKFIETIATGWWTTCLEILPAKERALSRY